jgi:hypothetical protein
VPCSHLPDEDPGSWKMSCASADHWSDGQSCLSVGRSSSPEATNSWQLSKVDSLREWDRSIVGVVLHRLNPSLLSVASALIEKHKSPPTQLTDCLHRSQVEPEVRDPKLHACVKLKR